jgi:hypothetical protein
MQMASADQTTYPKFTQYVRFSMPKLVDVPVIVNALRNIGQINLARMRLVLKWGSGPMLRSARCQKMRGVYARHRVKRD